MEEPDLREVARERADRQTMPEIPGKECET